MSNVTKQLCDTCECEISSYRSYRSIAFLTVEGLAFQAWDDSRALRPEAKHFCSDNCAKRALERYLDDKRIAGTPVAAAPPVQELDSRPTPGAAVSEIIQSEYRTPESKCNCWCRGDSFKAPEQHAKSCPESLESRRREENAAEVVAVSSEVGSKAAADEEDGHIDIPF